jgi:hypothetical protein
LPKELLNLDPITPEGSVRWGTDGEIYRSAAPALPVVNEGFQVASGDDLPLRRKDRPHPPEENRSYEGERKR